MIELVNQKRNNLRKNKKGFTLVEVIVVLVILAILAAILVPSMIGWINKANEKTSIVEARNYLLAAQTIVSDNYTTYKTAAKLTETDLPKVIALGEIEGSVSGDVAVTAGKIASFTYIGDGYKVVYNAKPDASKNEQKFTSSKI